MSEAIKPCPLCAEDISPAATVCPYCGAKFAVTSSGYCTTCHAVRDATETGLCNTCGNSVADWRLESRLIEEPIPNSMQPAAAPTCCRLRPESSTRQSESLLSCTTIRNRGWSLHRGGHSRWRLAWAQPHPCSR